MFSFIRKYAETIQGAEMYPKIALMIFLGFFLFWTIWIMKVNRGYIKELEEMPHKD